MTKPDIEIQRHSYSHILAAAVQKLYPGTKFGIGPVIEDGFYYDFDLKKPLSPDDLPKITEKMQELIKKDIKFAKKEVSKAEAKKIFADQPFKLQLIDELESDKATIYITEDFTDLCRGPHVSTTQNLKADAFKLMKIAGAYWQGDEKNKMLTRIYGVAFETAKDLQTYLTNLAEAEKRDHRKLGKQLDLFIFSDLVGPGLPIYTPKGTLLRKKIQDFSKELRQKMGFAEVFTPQLTKADLFKTSGHYDKYKDDMFRVVSNYTDEEYFVKPMNCPQHNEIYKSKVRSYKDLPIRYADFANLYRDEKPGELSGLTRLRFFSQDDGHVFCTEDQVEQEYDSFLSAIKEMMTAYGLDYYMRLSLRDEQNKDKYIGTDEDWQKSQKMLEDLLINKKIKFVKAEGEAAFYGPKLDLIAKDALNREWQLSTAQLDPNMPKRFGLEYTGADGKKHTPIMIHNALAGSPERMMAILLENYAGAFPVWLAPVQVWIIPIGSAHKQYAADVTEQIKKENITVELQGQNETIGKKIREGEVQKIPYLLIVGDKEIKAKTVAVRDRKKGDIGAMSLTRFIDKIKEEISNKQ